jgi:hypothetical protein
MLVSRCDDYYDGNHYEIKSATSILYTLLYDHGNSAHSLLGQLGMLDSLKFLDSRHPRHGLVLNTARGAWPTTTWPEKPHKEENLCDFTDWWENQPFHILHKNLVFTRKELVELIRHKEGGSHIAPKIHKKIAAVRRSRSPWRNSVKNNEDGTTDLYVGIDLSNREPESDEERQPISDHELGSLCAIAEEVLFSILPEPENRKRMVDPAFQQPLYLSRRESGERKKVLRAYLKKLQDINCSEIWKQRSVDGAIDSIQKTLDIDVITSEEFDEAINLDYFFKIRGIEWTPPKSKFSSNEAEN